MQFAFEDLTADQVTARLAVFTPLTESVRDLVDATIRTEVDPDAIAEAHALITRATALLRARQLDGPYGVRFTPDGIGMPWGNAAIGLRNPIAPPMVIENRGPAGAHSDFVLGAAYEGPPGLVHGGVCALLLDQLLGSAAGADGTPAFTGTLTIRFRRATQLGPLHGEASVSGLEGRKKFARGSLSDAEGVTVEAEGVFIIPAAAAEDGR